MRRTPTDVLQTFECFKISSLANGLTWGLGCWVRLHVRCPRPACPRIPPFRQLHSLSDIFEAHTRHTCCAQRNKCCRILRGTSGAGMECCSDTNIFISRNDTLKRERFNCWSTCMRNKVTFYRRSFVLGNMRLTKISSSEFLAQPVKPAVLFKQGGVSARGEPGHVANGNVHPNPLQPNNEGAGREVAPPCVELSDRGDVRADRVGSRWVRERRGRGGRPQ